jgi:hypothetical protein
VWRQENSGSTGFKRMYSCTQDDKVQQGLLALLVFDLRAGAEDLQEQADGTRARR